MRYLLVGSNGFIGKNVAKLLREGNEEVFLADRGNTDSENNVFVDLFDKESIKRVILKVKPDVVLNLAGSVENTEKALGINPVFTRNLLDVILGLKNMPIKKIIITGSAGEYGEVAGEGPVNEDTPLSGQSYYAKSKIMETSIAKEYKEKYNLPINIVRIFNPVGVGMHPRFLIPSILRQIEAVNRDEKNYIEISRLDSARDYINIRDIARAIILIAQKKKTKYCVYNLGSGVATSNGELIRQSLQLESSKKNIEVRQTSENSEKRVADQADIFRLKSEFSWNPEISLEETIKEIISDQAKQTQN